MRYSDTAESEMISRYTLTGVAFLCYAQDIY